MSQPETKIIQFEEGWSVIEKHIKEHIAILETNSGKPIDTERHMNAYSMVYTMCTQRDPHDYSHRLYHKYHAVFVSYCAMVVLPCLRGKRDEVLLRAFVERWAKFKTLARWMSHLFHYLECYFIQRMSLPGLKLVILSCFCELVYKDVGVDVKEAVMGLLRKRSEGESIDSALLKSVFESFSEMELPASELDFGEQYLAEGVDSIKPL